MSAKSQIVDTLRRLAAEGIAVMVATSDLAEIEGAAMTAEALASAASATPGDSGADA